MPRTVPPGTENGDEQAGGKDPPGRPYLHLGIDMREQDEPCVNAASEPVEQCFEQPRRDCYHTRQYEKHARRDLSCTFPQYTVREQPEEKARHQHRLVLVQLGLHEKVRRREWGDQIDEAVQCAPARCAEAANRRIRRSCSECEKTGQTEKADSQVNAQRDLARDFEQMEVLIQDIQ